MKQQKLRLQKLLPQLNALSTLLIDHLPVILPKSPLSKALCNSIRLWYELMTYLFDCRLEIDNNLMENAIRPNPLGRKNYLFAGSHDAAQNIAMCRSLYSMCYLNQVNPYQWTR